MNKFLVTAMVVLPMLISCAAPPSATVKTYVGPDDNNEILIEENICPKCIVRQDQPNLFSVWSIRTMTVLSVSQYIILAREGFERIYHQTANTGTGKDTDIWFILGGEDGHLWTIRFELIASGFKD